MNTQTRLLATKVAQTFQGDEDRAWTTHQHPGQLTIADYRRLDRTELEKHRRRDLEKMRRRPRFWRCWCRSWGIQL